jgi:hypothetical protein
MYATPSGLLQVPEYFWLYLSIRTMVKKKSFKKLFKKWCPDGTGERCHEKLKLNRAWQGLLP